MALSHNEWSAARADEWTLHDLAASVLSVVSYMLTVLGTAGTLLAQVWGYIVLVTGIVSVVLMYLVIDPKLRAMSKAFAQRQDEFLKHVDRTTRWEQSQ